MAKTLPRDDVAFEAVRQALTDKRAVLYIDAHLLGRPGSPVFNSWDMFGPLIALMLASMLVLFLVGILEWIAVMTLVLLYQVYLAQKIVSWRLHQRTLSRIMTSPYDLQMVWRTGGVALALANNPEFNCIAPLGDWRVFTADHLIPDPETAAMMGEP